MYIIYYSFTVHENAIKMFLVPTRFRRGEIARKRGKSKRNVSKHRMNRGYLTPICPGSLPRETPKFRAVEISANPYRLSRLLLAIPASENEAKSGKRFRENVSIYTRFHTRRSSHEIPSVSPELSPMRNHVKLMN